MSCGFWVLWRGAIGHSFHTTEPRPVGAQLSLGAPEGLGLALDGQALPAEAPVIPFWAWSLLSSLRGHRNSVAHTGPWRPQVSSWRSREPAQWFPGSGSPLSEAALLSLWSSSISTSESPGCPPPRPPVHLLSPAELLLHPYLLTPDPALGTPPIISLILASNLTPQ